MSAEIQFEDGTINTGVWNPETQSYVFQEVLVTANDHHWQRYVFAGAVIIGAAAIYKKYGSNLRKSGKKK